MTPARFQLRCLTICLCFLVGTGCKLRPITQSGEFHNLLQTVAYDTSTPVIPANDVSAVAEDPPDLSDVGRESKIKTMVQSVAYGLMWVGAMATLGVLKLAGTALGSDDDDAPYDSSPRAEADRELNSWVDGKGQL